METWHSALNPAGQQAAHIAELSSFFLVTMTVIFGVVLAALLWAILHRGARQSHAAEPALERRLWHAVTLALITTIALLFLFFVSSLRTGQRLASLEAPEAVTVTIVGHQWWWDVFYEDSVPARRVQTANEIHLPINRPIALNVAAADVIHSFWAPSLHGKRDLIPGMTTTLWLRIDQAGVHRGQCAEFCGRQHAHMAFEVIAEPDEAFRAWLEAQRLPAVVPQSTDAARGRDVFLSASCHTCHTIAGTPARGHIGPDLTHLASRTTLGAGTLPNNRDDLARWITNSQAFKPGNQMPPQTLPEADLAALVSYLETLR